ncbi:hypothetical protein SCHPADRAFT_887874 [Schizopora paradoxa]|uniref:Uncharacterized protein n=1 Tax=Schizopora paradoxa TaxID=27342 RepID=A0A0H2S397_9AGAM|nr:hypothetical protein SCHPADRAFT_887874 [Schizopora paradoxa]
MRKELLRKGVHSDDSGYGEVLGRHNPNFVREDLENHLAEEDRGLDVDPALFAMRYDGMMIMTWRRKSKDRVYLGGRGGGRRKEKKRKRDAITEVALRYTQDVLPLQRGWVDIIFDTHKDLSSRKEMQHAAIVGRAHWQELMRSSFPPRAHSADTGMFCRRGGSTSWHFVRFVGENRQVRESAHVEHPDGADGLEKLDANPPWTQQEHTDAPISIQTHSIAGLFNVGDRPS